MKILFASAIMAVLSIAPGTTIASVSAVLLLGQLCCSNYLSASSCYLLLCLCLFMLLLTHAILPQSIEEDSPDITLVSKNHAVQHSLRGSILDKDSTTDEELYSKNGGNCCGVHVGGKCPAGYQSFNGSNGISIGSINGMQMCCLDPQNVVITGDNPMCKGSTRAPPPKPKAQGTIPCTEYGGGAIKSCPQGFDMYNGRSGCTCTPSNARKRLPRMPRKQPRQLPFPTRAPRTQRWSAKCNVVNNAMNRAMGCLNVGDDQSTCEACGCRYVAFTRMCVK